MNRIFSGIAVGAVLASGLVLANPSEASAQESCVTRAEFRNVHRGMSKAAVHRVFDTSGRRSAISHAGGYTFEIRSYRACTQFGAISIGFENGRLQSKSAVF
jgi:hypothetical protein